MKKAITFKLDLTKSIFIALVLILYFLFINNPFSQVKEMANANLLLIGSLGFLIFGIGTRTYYEIKNKMDLASDSALGIILGVVGIVVIGVLLRGASGVFNLAGTIAPASIAAISSSEQIFFIALVYPLTETIILIGGALFLYSVLKGIKGVPYPKVVAGLAIVLLFAAFHFNAIASGKFEYSATGFINFIGNTHDYSASAFPQLLMGMYWVFLGYTFRSWIVPAVAHIVSNTYALVALLGLNPTLILLFLLYAGIVFVVWQRTGLKEFKTFSLREVFV